MGVEIHYVNRGKLQDTPEGRMTENMEAVFAEYWREKIIEGSRRGRRAKARNGEWVGTGLAPYGYWRDESSGKLKLAINEEEADVVRRIFALYTGVNGQRPMAVIRIATNLMAEKVPPPGRGKGPGRGWYTRTILAILSRTIFIGEFEHYGSLVKLPELAIVDCDIWEAAQKRREKNKQRARRNQRHDYLLSGHFRCTCGAAMSGYTKCHENKRKPPYVGRYYRCNFRGSDPQLATCKGSQVKADWVEAPVWDWLASLLADDANLEKGLRRMIERRETDLSPKRERLALVTDLIKQTEHGIKRLAKAYAEAENDIVAAALQAELKSAGKQVNELNEERELLNSYIVQGEFTPEETETIKKMAAELRAELANPTFETKRYLLDKLDCRVQLRCDEAGRWLDVTCGWTIKPEKLPIESSSEPSLSMWMNWPVPARPTPRPGANSSSTPASAR